MRVPDPGGAIHEGPSPPVWIVPGRLLTCGYPGSLDALQNLHHLRIQILINLTEWKHDETALHDAGMVETHIPVPDFTAPTSEQIDACVDVVNTSLSEGRAVAIHCLGGRGRSGTMAACYLVSAGLSAPEAIDTVREVLPGAVETQTQVEAVSAYADSRITNSVHSQHR